MKTITLLLPDNTYDQVLTRARSQGFDARHYLSSLVIEQIDLQNKGKTAISNLSRAEKTENYSGDMSIGNTLPDTIEQVLAICKYVWKYNFEYGEAVRKVSSQLNIEETTVRDKCTRRISSPNEKITTDSFYDMLLKREPLRDYLCRRFPKNAEEIKRRFNEILK